MIKQKKTGQVQTLCPEKKRHIIKIISFKQRLKCLYDLLQSKLHVSLAPEVISNSTYLQIAYVLESLLQNIINKKHI